MPKLKTCKAITKRISITRHGKLKMYKPGRRHLLSTKSAKRKRKLRRPFFLAVAQAGFIKESFHKKI